MSQFKVFIKDPDALLDYQIDWSSWLGTDTISASTWEAFDTDITINEKVSSFEDTNTIVWVSDGEVGSRYTLTNHIETAAGRKNDRSIVIRIKEL